jgi:hypothetical protein
MVFEDSTTNTTFDVGSINQQHDHLNRGKLAAYWGVIALGLGMALIFAANYLPAIVGGRDSALHLADLATGVVVGGLICQAGISGLRQTKGGVRRIRVDSEVLGIGFQERPPIEVSWSDPKLSFDLYDLTGLAPEQLRYPCAYIMRFRGFDFALTSELGSRIVEQIQRHGLSDSVVRGGRWIYGGQVAPLIHHVSPRRRTGRGKGIA